MHPSEFPLSAGHAAVYNHAIAGLMLCEAYGMPGKADPDEMRAAIEKAIAFTRKRQTVPKSRAADKGGWRYIFPVGEGSDLSVTSWFLMFLRSAKNAGFDVPSEFIDEGMAFVKRCFDSRVGTFDYTPGRKKFAVAMAGAGALAFSLGGLHDNDMARNAGNFIVSNPSLYRNDKVQNEQVYYTAFYCSQATLQLGGRYWKRFFPSLVGELLPGQHRSGFWPHERGSSPRTGNVYPTSMAVLSLTAPYQMLPIFQR